MKPLAEPPHNSEQDRARDEAAIRAFIPQLVSAWNRGSGEGFAEPFSEDADFIAFEGSHLHGRAEIAAFHQRVFDSALRETKLQGGVRFVRFLGPELAIVHAWGGTILRGAMRPSPSRDSMQLLVAVRRDGAWQLEALMNARKITLEGQAFSDELAHLSADGQKRVNELVHSLH